MDAKQYLHDYSKRADKFLDRYFDKKLMEATKIGESGNGLINVPQQMMSFYQEYVRGGKKLRGALVQLGYECGNANGKSILQVCAGIEIIHSFLLMHDDVMDQDSLRRGQTTMHKQWEILCRKKLKKHQDPQHYGESMAYTLGDTGGFLGIGLVSQSNFPSEVKAKAITYLTEFLVKTAYGQSFDLTYEASEHLNEDDIFRVHRYKTANYTIMGPLKLGGIFAGLSNSSLKAIEKYGESVGIAFQLRDDELGIFGDEKTIGKPVGSDIREDKNTLLHVKALEMINGKDGQFLKKTYGKKNLTTDDIARVQKITIDSGALAYSQNLTKQLINQGKQSIPQITKHEKQRKLLAQIADFIVERKK